MYQATIQPVDLHVLLNVFFSIKIKFVNEGIVVPKTLIL